MNFGKLALFVCGMALCLDTCLSQNDCTGVECPVLQNCIEEVLEKGACCATCLRRGCSCEGYQYYDCVNAGFRKGKVEEGKSYFVDFGSTECSCPLGGGRISCRFIPCPDLPANCIDILQPADGCPQCGRVGCVHGTKKYEAGHSFHMDPCQVCHCPNDGGSLMCSPVPDCDPGSSQKPLRVASHRDSSPSPDRRQTSPLPPFSKLALANTLPLYKQDPPSFGTDVDDDYTSPQPASSTLQDPIQLLEPSTAPPAHPESSSTTTGFLDDRRQERRQKPGAFDQERRGEDGNLRIGDQATSTAQGEASTSTTTSRRGIQENQGTQQGASERTSGHHGSRDSGAVAQGASRSITDTGRADKGTRHVSHQKPRGSQSGPIRSHSGAQSQRQGGPEQNMMDHRPPFGSNPKVRFSPTSKAPVRVRGEREQHRRQPQTLTNYQSEAEDPEVSAKELVEVCCETGEKWATANGHCNSMELPRKDRHSICRTAQKQCCLGSLREALCFAGMNAAREGNVCREDTNDKCGIDSFNECCSCCSLGLRFRSDGHRCEAHQYLGYPCSHIFLTCCEGEEGEQGEGDGWHPVRERPSLDPTALPKKVSDSPFPKEAFSIGDEQDGYNTVEGPPEVKDMDECAVYQGNLCHHRCVNTPGSFRCECFPGFQLQEDGVHCAKEMVDDENRLKEDDRAEGETTTTPPPSPTQPPVALSPCEGNGPCMQQCTLVDGKAHCSCFPGFSLMADGQSCEDINECLSPWPCQQNEDCMNTAGSFRCQRRIPCPPGYRVSNDICEDINECIQGTNTCGSGFDCMNTEGSFHCVLRPQCPSGFTRDSQGNCIDTDECTTLAQPCTPGFNCVNTVGSYTCQRKVLLCSRGYHASPDESRCIDVDECQANLHRCGEDQLCQNLPGSYRCDCQTGYQYDTFRRMCVDVNECWRFPGRLCAQTCENTPGSYQCSCTTGFRLSNDGKNCEDVNECLTSPCSQECANIYGSYQCYCRQGYHLRGDGHTCEDIDECTQSIGHLCSYKCVNVPGSYQCTCPEYGYSMSPNGRSCRDIDECTTGAHNCSLAETCYNIQGGHRCLDFSCPENYRKVSDTRCERISCPGYLDCQNSPMRITYYYLSFQSNIVIPAQIFRIGPSPAYSGDNVIISITHGNEDNYFSTRKLNTYTGAVFLHRQVRDPQDFLIDVEMKLWRQGSFTTFLARIYVFITANSF